MQIYALLAIAIGWVASVGVTGWKAYEMGQSECQLEVVRAAQAFVGRRKKYIARINERNLTRAETRSERSELRNDKYEKALDVIELYGVQLEGCKVPSDVREAISAIN